MIKYVFQKSENGITLSRYIIEGEKTTLSGRTKISLSLDNRENHQNSYKFPQDWFDFKYVTQSNFDKALEEANNELTLQEARTLTRSDFNITTGNREKSENSEKVTIDLSVMTDEDKKTITELVEKYKNILEKKKILDLIAKYQKDLAELG